MIKARCPFQFLPSCCSANESCQEPYQWPAHSGAAAYTFVVQTLGVLRFSVRPELLIHLIMLIVYSTHPVLPADLVTDIKQFSESEFARQYFSTHRTGFIFRRKVPVAQMMVWQKVSSLFFLFVNQWRTSYPSRHRSVLLYFR